MSVLSTYRPTTGFNATAFQVREAYQQHFGRKAPEGMPYAEMGAALVKSVGLTRAQQLVNAIK